MRKIFVILFLLAGMGFSGILSAQNGGRKREGHVKTKKRGDGILTQYKSRGHADEFARGTGRRGLFARLFKKTAPSWRYRSSGSKKSHFRDNQALFTRNRTKGKMENAQALDKQNAERSRNRVHGSKAFRSRRYR